MTIQPQPVSSPHNWVKNILNSCINTNRRTPINVDILMGIDNLWKLVQSIEINSHYGFALFYTYDNAAIFGGTIPDTPTDQGFQTQSLRSNQTHMSNDQLSKMLEKLWEVSEPLPHERVSQPELTQDENLAISTFKRNLRFIDRRYEVGLLWKSSPVLANNYNMARASVERLKKKLIRNLEQIEAYEQAMYEYIENDDVEIDNDRSDGYFFAPPWRF